MLAHVAVVYTTTIGSDVQYIPEQEEITPSDLCVRRLVSVERVLPPPIMYIHRCGSHSNLNFPRGLVLAQRATDTPLVPQGGGNKSSGIALMAAHRSLFPSADPTTDDVDGKIYY